MPNTADITAPKQQNKKKVPGRPFPKGVSGNPAGRPKGSVSIIGRIRQIWEDEPEEFETYVRMAIRDPNLRRELIHQIDGKPKERIEMSGALKFGNLDELDNDELARLAGEG